MIRALIVGELRADPQQGARHAGDLQDADDWPEV